MIYLLRAINLDGISTHLDILTTFPSSSILSNHHQSMPLSFHPLSEPHFQQHQQFLSLKRNQISNNPNPSSSFQSDSPPLSLSLSHTHTQTHNFLGLTTIIMKTTMPLKVGTLAHICYQKGNNLSHFLAWFPQRPPSLTMELHVQLSQIWLSAMCLAMKRLLQWRGGRNGRGINGQCSGLVEEYAVWQWPMVGQCGDGQGLGRPPWPHWSRYSTNLVTKLEKMNTNFYLQNIRLDI